MPKVSFSCVFKILFSAILMAMFFTAYKISIYRKNSNEGTVVENSAGTVGNSEGKIGGALQVAERRLLEERLEPDNSEVLEKLKLEYEKEREEPFGDYDATSSEEEAEEIGDFDPPPKSFTEALERWRADLSSVRNSYDDARNSQDEVSQHRRQSYLNIVIII